MSDDLALIERMPPEYQASTALAVALRDLRRDPGGEEEGERDAIGGALIQESLDRLGWCVVRARDGEMLRAQVSALARLAPVAAAAADAADAPWWRRGKALRRLRGALRDAQR